ncbi:hypothetical protein JHK87_033536 [Glycine soja]|nr:hypothetical protein JHK87_033536 [Glycine soja]
MRFTVGALVDHVSRVFVPLGASHTSLQFVMVGLQFSELLLMVIFHLCNVGLKLAESVVVSSTIGMRGSSCKRDSNAQVIIDSNPDASPPLLNPNRSSSSEPSVYPFVDYNDLIKNLFPEDVIAAKSPFVPPEATEEVLLWIPGVILNLIDKDYNVDLACSDFFGILFWLGDKVVSVYMRVADEIQWLLAKDTTVVKVNNSH